MHDIYRLIGDLFVLLIVAFPPFLYLYRYSQDRIKKIFFRILIFLIYWVGTFIASNLIPAAAVLFIVWRARKENSNSARGLNGDEDIVGSRKFKLDCSGPKWKFSLGLFIKVSLLGIVIKYAVSYANYIAIEIVRGVFEKFNINLENQEIINEFLKSNLLKGALFFIVIVFCAPIVEEFVFRFWIYDRILKKRIGPVLSMVFSSLLFTAAHFNIQGALAFFLIGAINCYLYEKKGYWAAVANHFMFNFSTVILLIMIKVLNIPLEI